jgi:hypothetical protein
MTKLPDNASLLEYAKNISWEKIDESREQFQDYLTSVRSKRGSHPASNTMIRHLTRSYFEGQEEPPDGNVLLSKETTPIVLGVLLGQRFQQGPWLDYVKPYNLNPAVNHENLHQAGGPLKLRPVGTELEVGMVRRDGAEPTAESLDLFHEGYVNYAQKVGATLDISPELCIYQAEITQGPAFGFAKLLRHLELNIGSLAHGAKNAGLMLEILSVYPTETDFATSHSDKVETVAIFLNDINESRPGQVELLEEVKSRYKIQRCTGRPANMLRFQGYHMHVDIAGRSEALGLLTYMLNLGSASAAANAALLKGGPFVDGVCDPDYLCAREHIRAISITGHYVGVPLSPHLMPDGLEKHAHLLRANLANGTARALLYGVEDDMPFSGMHNMLGRVRPDLDTSKRVCTLESTGMPSNPSAERLAAVAADYQFSQLALEHYFRKYGTNLDPLYSEPDFLEVFGALDRDVFHRMIDASDRYCTDMELKTANGTTYGLLEFYEKKRRLLKRLLAPLNVIDTRDIDSLYDRIYHFLVAPNGGALTIDDYINHPTRRGTGNWGRILRNAFLEAGGTLGVKDNESVLKVVEQLHLALQRRYVEI